MHIDSIFKTFNKYPYGYPYDVNNHYNDAMGLKDNGFIVSFAYIQFLSQPMNCPVKYILDKDNLTMYMCNTGFINTHTKDDDMYKFPIGRYVCGTDSARAFCIFDCNRFINRVNIFYPLISVRLEKKEDVEQLTSSRIYELLIRNKKLYMEVNILTMHDYFLNITTGKLE